MKKYGPYSYLPDPRACGLRKIMDKEEICNALKITPETLDNWCSGKTRPQRKVSIRLNELYADKVQGMKPFKIPCFYQIYAIAKVMARDLDQAIVKVRTGPLPENGNYVEGSFKIDHEAIAQHNDKEKS